MCFASGKRSKYTLNIFHFVHRKNTWQICLFIHNLGRPGVFELGRLIDQLNANRSRDDLTIWYNTETTLHFSKHSNRFSFCEFFSWSIDYMHSFRSFSPCANIRREWSFEFGITLFTKIWLFQCWIIKKTNRNGPTKN